MNSTSDDIAFSCLIRLYENQVIQSITFEPNLVFDKDGSLPTILVIDDENLVFHIFLQTEQGEPLSISLNSLTQKQKDKSLLIFLERVTCMAITMLKELYHE